MIPPGDDQRHGALLRTVEELIPELLAPGVTAWPIGSQELESSDGAVLNAFLSAATVCQVLEDHLRRDVFAIDRIARRAGLVGRLGRALAGAANRLGTAAFRVRPWWPAERRWERDRVACAELVSALADRLAALTLADGPEAAGDASPPPLSRSTTSALQHLARSRLRRQVQRLPGCFSAFDQQPEDFKLLMQRFAARWPERQRPVLVVGLRTSGSYLAPLCASFLRSLGYERAAWMTLRPGLRLARSDARIVTAFARQHALTLIVDDPPRTGRQVLRTAKQLEELGVPAERIVPVLGLLPESGPVEDLLRRYPSVLLPWPEWTICTRLRSLELVRTLEPLVVGQPIPDAESAERRAVVGSLVSVGDVRISAPTRGHVSATIDLTATVADGRTLPLRIRAEGIGLGYFADPARTVARRLSEFIPIVYGLHGGLLYREWLGEGSRLTDRRAGEDREHAAAAIARYVETRRRLLGLPEDLSLRLTGEAVWEEVAVMLARTFGTPGLGYLVARPLARRSARRLLAVQDPTLIDGDMRVDRWFVTDQEPALLLKTSTWRGRYTGRNLHSGDWALDLAAAAADLERRQLAPLARRLRETVERDAGTLVDDERWLLYRLLDHLIEYEVCLRQAAADDGERLAFERALALERLMARTLREYMEDSFFADLMPNQEGPLCAIDVDGVLEERWLAFPVLAPAGASALRALNRHGARAVLATGRSLPEVRERCAAYRLAGGVAEYGAAIYDHGTGRAQSLVTAAGREHLTDLRDKLAAQPRVYLDPDHDHSIRAHAVDRRGRRSGLDAESIEDALAGAPPGAVRAVRGDLQTDFVLAGIDKGSGLRALAAQLGNATRERVPVALAIGDTDADVPMFAVAERAYAPANATAGAAARARRLSKPCANGLLDAVEAFVGHAPGRCPRCRPAPRRRADEALLLAWLGALNGGRTGKASALASVMTGLLREASRTDRVAERARATA